MNKKDVILVFLILIVFAVFLIFVGLIEEGIIPINGWIKIGGIGLVFSAIFAAFSAILCED